MSNPEVLQMFVDDQEILLQMNDAEIEWLKDRVAELEKEIELWKTADSKAVAAARAETANLWEALSAAKELFEDECTPDERDAYVWLMQTEELLGR